MVNETEAWQQLFRLLRADGTAAGLRNTARADTTTLSLLNALASPRVAANSEQESKGQEVQQSLETLQDQLLALQGLSRSPIVAFTGLLNAGKSSLLASYLSPSNRQRVLRGLSNASGTHRFVLWLPKVWWEEPILLRQMIEFLTTLFGHPPEQLSQDPAVAALQYNGKIMTEAMLGSLPAPEATGASVGRRLTKAIDETASEPEEIGCVLDSQSRIDPLSVPLIAHDEDLDQLKLGLLDCPDIQTGFVGSSKDHSVGSELALERKNNLSRMGKLCSAFVIVTKLSSLHDEALLQILTTLRDTMPGVPRVLAVNKVTARYAPDVVREQAAALVDRFGIKSVYVSYDYRSALADRRIPAKPDRMRLDDSEPLPIFFQPPEPHKTIDSTSGDMALRYLFNLGDELDVGSLSRESSRSLRMQLKVRGEEALSWLQENLRLREKMVDDARQTLAEACYEFMAERDASGKPSGLRLQASPKIIGQIADSLHRTAPRWMKLSLSIDRTARQLQSAVANSAARLQLWHSASESVTKLTRRLRRGDVGQVVTPQRLAEEIRRCDDEQVFDRMDQQQLEADCELAMRRFAEEDQTELEDSELDKWSRQVWSNMSTKEKLWKGSQPLVVITAPLLAAILVPIDAGGSAVLVFASVKELMAAAGIAAVMTPMATGGETISIVHREAPWRQLSDLFAILCDSLGIRRPATGQLPKATCNGEQRPLEPSQVASKLSSTPSLFSEWELVPEVLQEYQLCLQELSSPA
jgi:hypothetical protein